jgi:hypothetical protein
MDKYLKPLRAFQRILNCNLRIYEHIWYVNYDFMSQKWEKNKSKVRFVESSFGQKVWSTFPVAQYRIASHYQNGAIVVVYENKYR